MDERRKEYPLLLQEFKNLSNDVKLALKILNGNGAPGVVAKVDSLEKQQKICMSQKATTISQVINFILKLFCGLLLLYISFQLGG